MDTIQSLSIVFQSQSSLRTKQDHVSVAFKQRMYAARAQFARVPFSGSARDTRTASWRSSASCSSLEGCIPNTFSTCGAVHSPIVAQAMTPTPNRARVLGVRFR